MSLLEEWIQKAADKAVDQVGDPKWVDSAVKKGHDEIGRLPESLRGAAGDFLNDMQTERDALASAGRYTFASITSYILVGKIDDAKLLYLRDRSTAAERRAARDAADSAMAQEKVNRDATWATVERVGRRALKLGQAALPFIITLI